MAASPRAALPLLLLLAAALLLSCCYASRATGMFWISGFVPGLPKRAKTHIILHITSSLSLWVKGGETQEKAAVTVPMSTDPSKCERMVPCDVDKCTEYCVRIGLGNERGFCSFLNTQFVCCCPIPSRRTATKISISSVKQV
jgi:hypothetical protein